MPKSKQLIVLTGGAGFIGSCTLHELNRRGIDEVVVVDSLKESEKWKNLVGKSFVDVLDKKDLFTWLETKEKDISGFIHLGACSSTVERDASYLLENNYRYSRRLAEYALRHQKRFVYASSAATYGDGAQGFGDNEAHIEKLSPLNMYGYSKQLFDLWLKREGALSHVAGIKFFNVFGPNEGHKGRMASALFHNFFAVQKEGVIRLFKSSDKTQFEDGEQKRDFIYVLDVASMLVDLLLNSATGLFNMGGGQAISWNQLAKALFKALSLPPRIEYIEMPSDLIGKYQNFTLADVTKLKKALNGSFSITPFEEAVRDYVQNYLLTGRRV